MTDAIAKLAIATGIALKKHHLTLATAESCTGGGLSYWLTSVPHSSQWFERGFITYSNAAKIELLQVNPATLETFGAVSEPTAREMAEGALKHSLAKLSIAITGTAGPDGGTALKPVGTVWMAWARRDANTVTQMQHFSGDRQSIREQSIAYCLSHLLEQLN